MKRTVRHTDHNGVKQSWSFEVSRNSAYSMDHSVLQLAASGKVSWKRTGIPGLADKDTCTGKQAIVDAVEAFASTGVDLPTDAIPQTILAS